MDHFFARNSIGRVHGLLEVNSVLKKWKIYLNFKIPEIFGFLDLGLNLEPDTWFYLFGHGISQTQSMWGHTQNFSSFGPLILHLAGGGTMCPPLSQMWSWDPLSIRVKRSWVFESYVHHMHIDLWWHVSSFLPIITFFPRLMIIKSFFRKKWCKL